MNEMNMRLCDVLMKAQETLQTAGIAEAKLDAWYLFEHAFGMTRVEYLLHATEEANESCCSRYEEMIRQRCTHRPLQHIIGTQEFMGLEFDVNEHVLIPRQDTECLVERVLQYAHNKDVLDVCTGSGCIIISLSHHTTLKSATALDVSQAALEVAKNNAVKLGVTIQFIESDLFTNVEHQYDVIVSNPPYIPTKVIEGLMEEVREYEPMLALDGKEDGLYFYRRIIQEAKQYLRPDGMLFFEIGHDQAEAVSALFSEYGYGNVMVEKDLAGLDRIVYATNIVSIDRDR